MKKHILQLLGVFLYFSSLSQPYSTGLLFDNNAYEAVPQSATLSKDDYDLPESISLKKWCPEVKNQGQYGTCTGWASAYYARTIIEAKQNNLSGSAINQTAFSPSWIYNQIRYSNDTNCKNGASLENAMELMQNKGTAKLSDYAYCCDCPISEAIRTAAIDYKIKGYKTLFSLNASIDVKTKTIKKALSEEKPVVIGFNVRESFYSAGAPWEPVSSDYSKLNYYNGHALCIIGYDDNKYGGAFQLINSWGANWGESGFCWIEYADLVAFCQTAFEVIEIPKVIVTETFLEGEITFELRDGNSMQAVKSSNNENSEIVSYKTSKNYESGTMFRFYISNSKPAYIYAIASDLAGGINKIFPHKENISPYLGYSKSSIPFPSESAYIRMDNTAGTDFLCILYSKEELDIDAIKEKMESQAGKSFYSKLNYALGSKLIPFKSINYQEDGIGFETKLPDDDSSVVPVIIEINHQ